MLSASGRQGPALLLGLRSPSSPRVAGALVLAPLAARVGRGPLLGWSPVLLPATLAGYAAAPSRCWGAAALFPVGLV